MPRIAPLCFDELTPAARVICEISGRIALLGFLNRWNETAATPLEVATPAFAKKTLPPVDWTPANHTASGAA